MIPALVAIYVLLIATAAGGSLRSFRLRERYGLPFLRTYHTFILLCFAYAAVNFIGEVFAPAAFSGPMESLVRAYMIIDLITIPLLGGILILLFLWVTKFLGRPAPRALKAAFFGFEVIFLAVFVFAFISYFLRGISTATMLAVLFLNGIIALILAAGVLALVFIAPAGEDPGRRRLARGLGILYAVSLAVLGIFRVLPRLPVFRDSLIAGLLPAGLMFLVNLPALFYLGKALRTRPARWDPAASEAKGLAGLASETGISDRESEIIRLVAQGLDNREIGKRLFISPKTVKNHMTSIYAKTGLRNRVQLANALNRPNSPGGRA